MAMGLTRILKGVHPNAFYEEFSESHEQMIEKVRSVILRGGKSADALPHRWGKTTIPNRGF